MRVAIYLRVSKKDGSQDTSNQLAQLEAYCAVAGWSVVGIYRDEESGRKGRGVREGFDTMFRDAGKRKFDLVLFWSLDRFSREGIAATLNYLRLLESQKVGFHSYQEEFLNTDSELVRPILLSIISHFAAYEAKRISERTRAGLERAVRAGKRLGRPNKQGIYQNDVVAMRQAGKTVREIATALNGRMSESSIRRTIKQHNR